MEIESLNAVNVVRISSGEVLYVIMKRNAHHDVNMLHDSENKIAHNYNY